MGAVITPGGRAGSDNPLGPGDLWKVKGLRLPEYIRIVANGLLKQGHSRGEAISLAVGAMKRWASGRGNVTPKVRAAAAAALAEWERDRAQARGTK